MIIAVKTHSENRILTSPKRGLIHSYENRPVFINNLESRTTDFVYDARGVRVKTVLGGAIPPDDDQQPDAIAGEEYYYLTGLQGEVLCEIERFGRIKTYYVYLNGKKLCKVRVSYKYFYHNDYLGSTKVMTDNAGIKVYSWLGYPFGKQYSITGLSYTTYRFTGKEFDQSTGLYYFGARYYMPEIGRFITADPIMGTGSLNLREPTSLNFHNYAKDNSLRYIDPDGKEEKEARDFGRTNLLNIIYGNDYTTFTNVVCDKFVSYAYRGAGHSDFPMSGEKYQGKWSNWFANMQHWFQQPGREFIALGDLGKYTPEEGDVIFFQQLSTDGKPIPGKYHAIMISEANSDLVRVMGARGKGKLSGVTGWKSFANITANNWYGAFIGIGRVIPNDKERITEENR